MEKIHLSGYELFLYGKEDGDMTDAGHEVYQTAFVAQQVHGAEVYTVPA